MSTPADMPPRTPFAKAAIQIADLSDAEANRVVQAVDAACRLVESEPHRAIPAVAALLLFGRPGQHVMRELFMAECQVFGTAYAPRQPRQP